ncbi:MAG: cysteine desulfurase CsdA [Bdellovibrio sp. CG10_big_fil_rev_8_21_14_0_10_47_8]|nr:MAG: cysteine desulfurase CsdA [Bdellovibrio sp. CG10_big_fil_rev_8_21_14_0_10_47_8]
MSLIEKNKFRADFPALTQRIRGKSLVYLDSAATAIKPWPVIEKIGHFYTYETANVHRGAHYLADKATVAFEASRERVRSFLNASSTDEIIFTAGTTASINLVAQSWGRTFLKAQDEIVISEMEHHANIVPWQMVCEQTGSKLKIVPIMDNGELDMEKLEKTLSSRTKILALTHCSNTLGSFVDIKAAAKMARRCGALILVDGAQAVAATPVDVQDLDVDFYTFSGHKIFGPYGIGVLYGRKDLLQQIPPYQGGGSMISTVTFENTTYNELPYKFEAGTPNIEGVIALGAALEYVTDKVGFAQIQEIEHQLLTEATTKLQAIPGVKIFGQAKMKAPILSFVVGSQHPSDVAQILDQEGIAVRAGHHCCMPLMKRLGVPGTVRASFSLFNNQADIDTLVRGVIKAQEMLQ